MGGKPRIAPEPSAARGRRAVAFLRGMNLGRRRITNDELTRIFADLGFANVTPFLASGNIVFDSDLPVGELAPTIARGLADALDYEVPTFVRSAAEVRAISAHEPFEPAARAHSTGKIQVMLLAREPTPAARAVALAQAAPDDLLAVHGREIYWLPIGNMSASELDIRAIERAVGGVTIRTKRTIDRIAARFLAD